VGASWHGSPAHDFQLSSPHRPRAFGGLGAEGMKKQIRISNSLQIAAEADACLRGEISFQELKMRIWPKLSEIAAARRMTQENETVHESGPPSKPESGQQSSDDSFAEESKSYEGHLVQSLKSMVQRLGASADPLLDIYILGGQVFDDFGGTISDREYEKLSVFRDLANEEAQLIDEDPSLKTPEADALRQKIREAVSNYLREAALSSPS